MYVFVRVFVCVFVSLCVCVCVKVCVIFVCVYLSAWQKHDVIRVALETRHLKREILFLACTMWSMIIIMI